MMNIIYGIIGIIIGFLLIIYAYPIKQFSGAMSWAEKMFGMGGTTTGVKMIGLIVIVGSFLWMTGTLPDFLQWMIGPFFGKRQAIS